MLPIVPESLLQRQADLELEAHLSGVDRYRKTAAKAQVSGRATQAGPHRWLMQQTVEPLATAIKAWRRRISSARAPRNGLVYTAVKPLKAEVLALLTVRTTLDVLGQRPEGSVPHASLCSYVGRAVLRELQWSAYAKDRPGEFRNFTKRLKGATSSWRDSYFGRVVRDREVEVPRWTRRETAAVGGVLIHLLLENTGIVGSDYENLRRKRQYRRALSLKPEVLSWLEACASRSEGLHPALLPMLVPPVDWTTTDDGGYLTNQLRREPLVRKPGRMEQSSAPSEEVLTAVNHLQQTAWKVNQDVLEVAAYLAECGGGVAGLAPMENEPIPQIPDDEGTEEQRRAHARRVVEAKKLNRARASRRLSSWRTLALAQRFREEPELYFVQKLDFRGRAYPQAPLLQPQGNDLARGLLHFAEPAPVALGTKAAEWLAVHGANCWGNDKVPFADRVDWAHEHTDEILAVYHDPVECRWWAEASEPWAFLAWCLEWGALIEDEAVESRIPVAMDGSNNGLQIFSLLLRDTEGAEATNVVPTEQPEDVYQRVADLAWARASWLPTPDEGTPDPAAGPWVRWLPEGLPRAAVKRPVMVLPYGGTQHSCREYLRTWAAEHALAHPHGWTPEEFFERTAWLAEIVWDAIARVVPAAVRGMAWLHSVADVATEAGVPLHWETPTGFRVAQAYEKTSMKQVGTRASGDVVRVCYFDNAGALDPKRQKNGVAPNFVHSLDAAAMARTVVLCREALIGNLSMVHDSFACPAADAELLARLLREAYVDVFTPDQLSLFRDRIQALLPEGTELPPLPEYGSLNPRAVLDSPYFFA